LVEAALEVFSPDASSGSRRILDLGTGSGAIILALASEWPGDEFYATDRSAEALAVARENAEHHGMEGRIRFLKGIWFAPVDMAGPGFDLIVSNPPYVRQGDLEGLQPEIRLFEPVAALDGGADGSDCLVHIILNAPRYLRPSGCLLLEIGYNQNSLLKQAARQAGCYGEPVFLKDYAGQDRVLMIKKKAEG
jgi:release factor glutamine methyltransferase